VSQTESIASVKGSVFTIQKKKPKKCGKLFLQVASIQRRKKMVVELWLNLELLESKHLESEEKERLIRSIINTIERKEITEDKDGLEIDYLKLMN
jgi:hypothetical protein